MDTAAIARHLRPFAELSPEQLEQTSLYLRLLLKWNARVNLTAVRAPEEMLSRHFGESFFAARRLLSPTSAETVIDLGSGAGFPGLPIALVIPGSQVTLIEANAKKATFLGEVVSALGLKNVKVVRQRGEDYPGRADLVIMRAVERFETSLTVAFRLVRSGGRMALMIGAAQIERAEALVKGMAWERAVPLPGSHSRVLLSGTKLAIVG